MTKSKKSSTKYSLRDFDPENEDFGSEIVGSKIKAGASFQHGHLGDMKLSSAKSMSALDDKKYAGKPVSKADLYGYESDYSESEVSAESSSEEESEEEVLAEQSEEAKALAAKLRNLDAEEDTEEKPFNLVTQSKTIDRQEKSTHVRNQLIKFDNFVDMRFKLQPLLNAANAFPTAKQISHIKKKNHQVSSILTQCNQELEGLMKDLLSLSFDELRNDNISLPEVDATSESLLQGFWNEMSLIDAAIEPFARDSLKKWHSKVTLSADLKAKKSLKMLNQDPFGQVQIAMQDEERLVNRTRIYRDTQKRRIGSQNQQENPEFTDIFDDNDFYQVLLKDWTANHGTLNGNSSSVTAVALKNVKKKHREGVDQRASKGRKLRYDVHTKLVNYMVPVMERGAWSDSKIDELYASLLGGVQ